MESADMILASEFCIHHNIELSLIHSLNESGLIKITTIDEKLFVPESQLVRLEKIVLLYSEMSINVAGIETITYLLEQMQDMQQQLHLLTNKLSRYEND